MERPFAVPLGYVEKVDRRERSFAVPFGHVTERVNAEGVKPLPYGRWFTGMVILLLNNRLPFRSPCYGKDQCGRGQAPSLRKMVYRNGNVVGGWPCAVPFGHVADICCMERSFAVPFDHVAEGVKPLPYGR